MRPYSKCYKQRRHLFAQNSAFYENMSLYLRLYDFICTALQLLLENFQKIWMFSCDIFDVKQFIINLRIYRDILSFQCVIIVPLYLFIYVFIF